MKPTNFSRNIRISAYAASLVVAFFSLFSSAPAVAACTNLTPLVFVGQTPDFMAYTVEAKELLVQRCDEDLWWSDTIVVEFSNNEPATGVYDDGLHNDGTAGDGLYGNIWRPSTTGPVTLTVTATTPYGGTLTDSVSGFVRPRFYGVESVPFQWVDTSGSVVQTTSAAIPIGFTFNYYGMPLSTLGISKQGALVMGRDWPAPPAGFLPPPYTPTPSMPDPTEPNNVIAPFWNVGLYGGTVYTRLDGSAPNRQFTVSWIDVKYTGLCDEAGCPAPGMGSFQVTLFEGSNDIVFRYLNVDFVSAMGYVGGADPLTVGVENYNGTQATLYAYTGSYAPSGVVSSQSALRLSHPAASAPPTITSANISGPGWVIVVGTGFIPGSGNTKVSLNGVDATVFQVVGWDALVFAVPKGATKGKVCITTSFGTGCSTEDITPPPTITSLGPNAGWSDAATLVSIYGTNFVPDRVPAIPG